MNQVHKVIWSRVKNCYIVVSEITKRVGRDNKASVTGIRPLRALLCAMVIAGCMLPADADAANGLIHAGTGATASGDSSIAYGYSAEAKKEHSIAQGTKAKAEEEYALAMGYQANAKGLQSLAIGKGAIAKGNNSIAEGAGAKGYAKDGIAIGNNAESGTADNKDPRIPSIESNNGVAVGNSAKASGGSSVSVGNDSIGNGPSSVAIGNAATANDVRTTAIGNNAHAEGAGSLSIGREASALTLENATSTNPLVTGTDEQLDRKGVMAIGDDAKASGNNSIALGTSAKAGDLEKTRNADSVTLTGSAKRITKLTTKRSVNNAVAIGTESSVQSDEDIAVGYRATTVASKYHQLPGSGQVAIGSNSNTYGSRGDVAIGSGAETNIRVKNVDHTNGPTEKRDAQSVAIGSVAKAYGSQAVAVGADTRAIGNSSVAIGTDDIQLDRAKLQSLLPGLANNENLNNKAPSDATLGSAALHDKPYYVKTASIGTASVALGAMSQAAGDASMAMGLNALAEGDASTAIGPLARSKGKNSIAMGVNANSQVDGGVALGADSVSNRQQTSNAYIPSGADTAQVNAIKATKGTTGAVSVGSDTVKRQIINVAAGTDDSDAVNVAQLKAVTSNASWTAQGNGNDVNAVKNGSKVNFADGTNTTASVTKDASGKVTTVKYKLKKDVNLGTDGSLTIGNVKINNTGINAGNKQITNVASGGDTITNAANIGDINRIVEAKDKYVTGGTADYQTNGDGTAALTGTNNLTANITGLKNNYVTSGSVSNDGKTLTLERNDTGKVNVDLSKIFTEVAKEDYHLVANPEAGSQGKYKADSNGNMVLTVANEKGDKKQVTLTDIASKAQQNTNTTNITNINKTIEKGLNFGGDSGADINKKLGEKLEIKGGASADLTDGNIGVVSDGTKLNVKLKKDVDLGPNGSLTINGKTYVNKDGLNANSQKITNVADGSANSDAVNLGQLNAAIGGTAKATTVKAKDANVTVTEGTNPAGGKEYTVGLGDKLTLGSAADKKIIVDGTSGKITVGSKVTIDGTTGDIQAGTVKVTGAGTVNELTNRTWDIDNPTVVHGQAATEDQLKTVSDGVKTNKTNITNINNTIGKGLNFGGDSGAVINKKLGEKLEIKGGASADLTDDNIGVVSDGTKLNVKLKKDVNLGPDGSLTVNGKTYVNKDGLNANNQKITNVATGTAGTDAVNVDQLNAAIAGTAKATTVKAKDANVTVTEGTNPAGGKEYTVGLGDKVTLGTADKKIVVDGTSGKITAGSKVTIDGTTGDIQAGTVKVTGAGTVNELTNRTWDIDNPTVVHGQAATEDQLKTVSDGVKTNKTNITNINNTIGKGLNFGGDSGAVINKKLGEKLEIKGGASADLTDDNIGVVSDGTKLNVKLKKDVNLGPDGSLTVNGKTYVNKDGLNANGQKITNVANGTANSDAVNFGQLKDAVAAGKTILKDGKNTTVEGEGTVANPYKVNVNDDLVLGKKGADGKDGSIGVNGKDGSSVVIHGKDGIGIKGKDGKDGVTLKAKDGANGTEGQIGLTGPAGKDGKSTHADIGVNAGPASLDPAKNLSATEMTRLYYVDEKGDHQVATMDDGMKFAGNTGLAIKKLNSTMTIRGTGTKADTEYDPSNIKTMVDADGNMIVGLDKNLKADSVGINGKDGRDGATIKGGDGKPGVDGTNITRLIIEEKNGKQHDIATLDDGMKYGGDTGAVIKKKLNGQVNVVGGIKDESKLTTDDNIGVVSDGSNNLKVRLAKDVKLNSVTAGNVVMDTTGFYVKKMTRTPAGTVSLTADGLNNGGNKIANIAAGEADTDAVNVSQLKNQGSEIVNKGFGIKAEDGNEVKKKLGEMVDVVGDGKNISTRVEGGRVRVGLKDDILLNSVTTGRTRMDTNGLTVQDGSGNTAVTVDKDGLKIKDGPSVTKSGIDAGGKKITNVAAGEADTDAVNVSQLKKAAASATTKVADGKNTTVTSETNADGSKTYHVNLNDDITLGTDPSKQISIKGTEGTIKAGQVTVNGTAGTVNGLTNKTWDPNHITSGQAATEDQLKVVSGQAGKHSSVTAGSNISVTTGTNANGGTDYKVSVVDTPTFKTVTTGNTVMSNSGLTIKNGPSITQTGVDAGGKRITNVAAGKADTDAVNVGQLKQIGGAINKVDNRINRVGAGAAALAALHPLDFDPDDKWDFTLGYGNYKDAHSLALGAFYRPNEDTMISVGGSLGGGENMVNAGLSMKLGQGNHVSTSKVAMAKEIKDLRAELENVKGALLKVADGRPLDSMDMDKMQLFPDVPENHWAYDYVATLAGNGVIVGYPDGQFGGDRMMTRYEMAALIYRAMQNGAAADDRMARALKEFEPELERIRVDTISKHKDGTPDIQRVRVIKGRG